MSRRREQGIRITWVDAFGVIRSPGFGAILVLGLVLLAIFLLWMLVANVIYQLTLGPEPPASIAAFARDVFTTSAGWAMIVVGVGVGFLFALLVLVVSFPLLLDRDVGLYTAVRTSIRALAANPGPMAVWGLIVADGLVIGSIPAFLGLVIVMPVLGHAMAPVPQGGGVNRRAILHTDRTLQSTRSASISCCGFRLRRTDLTTSSASTKPAMTGGVR
jgi:uncharacterized membrane protein